MNSGLVASRAYAYVILVIYSAASGFFFASKQHYGVAALLNDGRECMRKCEQGGPPLVCYFKFEIESYHTMSKACYNCPIDMSDCFRSDCVAADGVARIITVVNRKLPGPDIQVCLGDSIVVDVVNSMLEESTTIHWHGHHQKFTPYMDGVPFITQCPIVAGTTFRYLITAAHVGTHFWHSHTGTQRADGAFGAMIIRQPIGEETHANLYDYDLPEHVIQLIDWIHESSAAKFQSHYHANGTNKPDNLLVNGMGRFRKFSNENHQILYTPLAKFDVQQGKSYRFRVINAGFLYCPIQISIDNHTMIIISADGSDVKPVEAESLTIYAGERWDFVINASKPVDNYWMKFRGLKDCGEKYNKAYSLAILHYAGADAVNHTLASAVQYEHTYRQGMHVNAVNEAANQQDLMTAAEMRAAVDLRSSDKILKPKADVSLTMSFDFYAVNHTMFHRSDLYAFQQVKSKLRTYTPQINHISMKMPSFPLLSQPESITETTFCDEKENTQRQCSTKFCQCVYKIDLPLHVVVELMLIDEAHVYDSNHPFHLHGHSFRILSIDRLDNRTTVEEVKALDKAGRIHRNLRDPPLKDTVTVPAGGFTILRFYTHNPGYWLLHCHLDFHVEVGMAVVLKVGEQKDFPSVPRNFPRCGDYYHVDETDTDRQTAQNVNRDASFADIIERMWNSFASNSAPRAQPFFIQVTSSYKHSSFFSACLLLVLSRIIFS